jgi:hypothetical protein
MSLSRPVFKVCPNDLFTFLNCSPPTPTIMEGGFSLLLYTTGADLLFTIAWNLCAFAVLLLSCHVWSKVASFVSRGCNGSCEEHCSST